MLVNLSYLCVLIVIWSNILSIQPPDCLRELSIIAVISSELMAVAGTGGRLECGMVAVGGPQSGYGHDRGRTYADCCCSAAHVVDDPTVYLAVYWVLKQTTAARLQSVQENGIAQNKYKL